MNSVTLIGRLTADPRVSYTSGSQTAVCKFKVAIDRYTTKEKATDFIPVTVFGKQAENCERYLAKGRMVGVSGRIQTGSYEKSDGTRVFTTDVIADRVEFLNTGEKNDRHSEEKPKEDIQSAFEELDTDVPF